MTGNPDQDRLRRRPFLERKTIAFERYLDKEDEFSYANAHSNVVTNLGKASRYFCADCKCRAVDWSYDFNDLEELVDYGGLFYSSDIGHYVPRCKKCHMEFDNVSKIQKPIQPSCEHSMYITFDSILEYKWLFCNPCGFYRRFLK